VVDWLDLFEAVQANQAPDRGLAVDLAGIRLSPGLLIPWTLDPDGDGVPEADGAFSFEDAQGNPVQPLGPTIVLALLSGGATALGPALASLPDGTVLVSDLNAVGPPKVSGRIRISLADGELFDTGGDLSITQGECSSSVTWIGIPLTAFAGVFPSSTFRTSFEHAGDTLEGEISMDGTPSARASVSLDGGPFEDYRINLATGEVTPLP